ncbi:probable 2-ketogluconate reductase [Protopterus annectens]|uniref:probable 2-ketogluconate reductase n=1 Tax=Protopterus annectens TaxID=7888 RepID=UPI001CFA6C31|nr:probable 2-ketogluconate reductase [Protopterus annectens]
MQNCRHVNAASDFHSTTNMEGLPCALLSDKMCHLPEDYIELVKLHFRIIWFKDFVQNQQQCSQVTQALFVWAQLPHVTQELLQSLPNLKVIVNGGVGVNHLDLNLISRFGVKVGNTPHVLSNATADMGMALMLASARRLIEGINIACSPETTAFDCNWIGIDVSGTTLGIIGMGNIGFKVAQRAKGFEMKILYHNRNRRHKEEEAVGAHFCEKIEDLLQQSDFVMIAVNLTPETVKLIGKRELDMMKPTATLINISRGQVVDQDALVEALQKGVIRAAALDVTYPEPLPRHHPLLTMKNVILSPHIGSATYNTRKSMLQKMVENAVAAINGTPLPDEVVPR